MGEGVVSGLRPFVHQLGGLRQIHFERRLDLAHQLAFLRRGDGGLVRANPLLQLLALLLKRGPVLRIAAQVEAQHGFVQVTNRRLDVFREVKGIGLHGGEAPVQLPEFLPGDASRPAHDQRQHDGGERIAVRSRVGHS